MGGSASTYWLRRCAMRSVLGLALVLCAVVVGACGGSSGSSANTGTVGSSGKGSASGGSGVSGSPVNVAMITFEVPGEDQLTPMTAGAQAAIKVIDREGGFGGRPVNVITCNSQLQPAAATDCAHKALADHPVAMIGCEPAWSASGLPVFAQAKIPSLNCLNTKQDFTSQWEFGLNNGGSGDSAALAAYACSRPSVKTFVDLSQDIPSDHVNYDSYVAPVLKACGKKTVGIFVPTGASDIAPYAAKVAAAHPDFVYLTTTGLIAQAYRSLEQNGIPASHIGASDVYYTHQILSQAPQMKGGIDVAEFNPWTLTSDPSVAEYRKALQGSSSDYRDPNVEWGYALMMWLYDSAKSVGFSKADGATLANYWRTVNNVPIPLSRTWTNPGPKQAPADKQPYARMLRWTGHTFVAVRGGQHGWFTGLK